MAELNHFAISSMLGSVLGPSVEAPPGQMAAPQLASTLAGLQHRRRHLWDEDVTAVRGVGRQYRSAVKAAFMHVRGPEKRSPDRVLADPCLNAQFVAACRDDFGVEDSPFRLSLTLLMLRKTGELRDLGSSRVRLIQPWRYAFASEMAARSIFYRYGLSVDSLICHPEIAEEFDSIARRLAPNHSSFEYRWAALNARKRGASRAGNAPLCGDIQWGKPIGFGSAKQAPDGSGVYSLHEGGVWLLVGATEDIRVTVDQASTIADPNIWGADLWSPDPKQMYWTFTHLATSLGERHGIVHNVVSQVRPVFNVPRGRRTAA